MLDPEIVAELRRHGGMAQMRWFAAMQSMHAKDRADAYAFRLCQVFYESVATGVDIEIALEQAEFDWRKYADAQNKRLENAPKFSAGPYSGQSTRHSSYAYPEYFKNTKIHLRNTVKILVDRSTKVVD